MSYRNSLSICRCIIQCGKCISRKMLRRKEVNMFKINSTYTEFLFTLCPKQNAKRPLHIILFELFTCTCNQFYMRSTHVPVRMNLLSGGGGRRGLCVHDRCAEHHPSHSKKPLSDCITPVHTVTRINATTDCILMAIGSVFQRRNGFL